MTFAIHLISNLATLNYEERGRRWQRGGGGGGGTAKVDK